MSLVGYLARIPDWDQMCVDSAYLLEGDNEYEIRITHLLYGRLIWGIFVAHSITMSLIDPQINQYVLYVAFTFLWIGVVILLQKYYLYKRQKPSRDIAAMRTTLIRLSRTETSPVSLLDPMVIDNIIGLLVNDKSELDDNYDYPPDVDCSF
jgi:hypothetical protein